MFDYQQSTLAEHADDIVGSFEEAGLPVPEDIKPPAIEPGFLFYWRAWSELSSERPQRGFPIPILKKLEYARWFGVSRLDEFLDILSAVDGHALAKAKGIDDADTSDTGGSRPVPSASASGASPWLDAGRGEAD